MVQPQESSAPHDLSHDLVKELKDYCERYPELRLAHHLSFDTPLRPGATKFVLVSKFPGESSEDWEITGGGRAVESRRENFQINLRRSTGSQRRLKQLSDYLGEEIFKNTTQTMRFPLSSPDADSGFKKRYGYKFEKNPHEKKFAEMNLALIDRLNPTAVLVEGHGIIDSLKQASSFEPIATWKSDETGNVFLKEWKINGKYPCFSFTHPSARGTHLIDRPALSKLIQEKVNALSV